MHSDSPSAECIPSPSWSFLSRRIVLVVVFVFFFCMCAFVRERGEDAIRHACATSSSSCSVCSASLVAAHSACKHIRERAKQRLANPLSRAPRLEQKRVEANGRQALNQRALAARSSQVAFGGPRAASQHFTSFGRKSERAV